MLALTELFSWMLALGDSCAAEMVVGPGQKATSHQRRSVGHAQKKRGRLRRGTAEGRAETPKTPNPF